MLHWHLCTIEIDCLEKEEKNILHSPATLQASNNCCWEGDKNKIQPSDNCRKRVKRRVQVLKILKCSRWALNNTISLKYGKGNDSSTPCYRAGAGSHLPSCLWRTREFACTGKHQIQVSSPGLELQLEAAPTSRFPHSHPGEDSLGCYHTQPQCLSPVPLLPGSRSPTPAPANCSLSGQGRGSKESKHCFPHAVPSLLACAA